MVKIVFSEEAREIYSFLVESELKKDKSLINSLRNKLECIKENPHYGNPIRKNLIPSYYRKKYSANNLFRVELPQFWRMLYTLTDDKIEIIAFILDINDHKKYDSRFGY